jgi:hypothetical protein
VVRYFLTALTIGVVTVAPSVLIDYYFPRYDGWTMLSFLIMAVSMGFAIARHCNDNGVFKD